MGPTVAQGVRASVVAVVATCVVPVAAEEPARHSYSAGLDLSYVSASGHPSWLHGSAGKLRYDGAHDGLILSRAFAEYRWRVAGTVDLNIAAEGYDDGVGGAIDLTEAYLQWRPLDLSPNRYRVKLGAFYPRVSLENTGPGWNSPYTITPSAINTWIAEEIRVFGAEVSVSRQPEWLGGAHRFSLHAAGFRNNDPAGGLLAWKGWSLHDRQTGFGDVLPLPPLPQIQPDGMFFLQDPVFIPFQEHDGDTGWYVNGEWQYGKRLMLRAMHYDNRADPINVRNGQYAWQTVFGHFGLQAGLPGDVGLVAQWLSGSTVMGPIIDGAYVVDVEYESSFMLVTKSHGRNRWSVRYDHFEVTENDDIPLDENRERGFAWTLAWRFSVTDHADLAAEWLRVRTNRPAWAYNDLSTSATEAQLQVSLRLRFGDRVR